MTASPPKLWSLAAAAAALLGTGTLCRAQPEVFYYQGLTEQENADVVAWSVLYWQRVDQGGGSPGTGFAFTNPTMNTHLFNPVRSARPTLELVGSIPEGTCDRMYELPGPVGWEGEAAAQARAAMKDLMLFGEITTDVEEDPWGSWEHLQLILAAPEESEVLAWNENGELISVDLPLEEVNAAAAEAALKLDLSPESQTVLATLISAGGYWASVGQSGDVPQWKALITGETSKAEQFRAKVDGYLALAGVPDASTQVIQANFGLFGELPVIGVRLSDCYVLMDPTNGNLSGPFESSSPLDARGLLSFHADAYEAGKAVRYYSSEGCTTPTLAAWHNSPPWNWWFGCPGCGPWTPWSVPALITNYSCVPDPASPAPRIDCFCTSTGTATDPSGRTLPVRIVCHCTSCAGTGIGTGPALGPNTPSTPAAPGVTPGPPTGATSCSCGGTEYWY